MSGTSSRRAAEERFLAIEFHPVDRRQHDDEFELNLIEAHTWRRINLHPYERPADQQS
jgi:hypothetical protein